MIGASHAWRGDIDGEEMGANMLGRRTTKDFACNILHIVFPLLVSMRGH